MESIFGKLPLEKEKEILEEVFNLSLEATSRIVMFPLIFDKEKVVESLKKAKEKLGEIL